MTYSALTTSSLITFTNTTGTAQVTSAGKALAALTINGVGGTVQMQDDLAVNAVASSILTLTNGTFDANGHALTVCTLNSSNSNTRTLILGSSVTLGGNLANNTAVWNINSTAGLTFTKNSANITVLTPATNIVGWSFGGANQTFNGLTLNAVSNNTAMVFLSSSTFSSVSVGAGWAVELATGITMTISNAFTWVGTAANPILVYCSNSVTGISTISCPSGACSLKWGGVQGITGSGGATFTATDAFNFGATTGWSISAPADAALTPAAIATAVWQDTTAGDFTTAGSIGKSLFTSGATPGAASGLALVGSAMNTTQIAGSATAATNLSGNTLDTTTGIVGVGSTKTSVVTSSMTPPGSVADQFGSNINPRMLIFDVATTTAALRNQATVVSASTNAAAPVLTVNMLTTAPATTDTFRIL